MRQFVSANWVNLGKVPLTKGKHTLRLELTQNDGAAALIALLSPGTLSATRQLKPDQRYAADIPGWFVLIQSLILLRQLLSICDR
jgi:hypothetical protein